MDFDRLRHHAVIRRHHKDRNVGRLSAAGAHRGKRGMAGRVDEGDLLAVLFDLVGADMLGDAAGLARDHIGIADGVEQRGLAVVDVTHDRDHRGARYEIFFLVGDVEQAFLDVGLGDAMDRVAEFGGDQLGSIGIDHVAGLHDLALLHEEFDDIDRALRHALRQLLNRDRLGKGHIARNLLARLLVHRPLEFLLAAARGRQASARAHRHRPTARC